MVISPLQDYINVIKILINSHNSYIGFMTYQTRVITVEWTKSKLLKLPIHPSATTVNQEAIHYPEESYRDY